MKRTKLVDKLKKSPINYFSDLFIVSMVVMWIVDNVYQSIIATAVTVSSIVVSIQTGVSNFDTSMWSSIGTNVAIPLSCGGAIWMIKNSIQHAIINHRGEIAKEDFPASSSENEVDVKEEIFPAVHPEGEGERIEIEPIVDTEYI